MYMKQIGVFGSSTTTNKRLLKLAQETGKLIADNKAVLFVGNTTGVLKAALDGAKKG